MAKLPSFRVLLTLVLSPLFFIIGVYVAPLVSAQSPCQSTAPGSTPRAEGLITSGTGSITGKFDNPSGTCVADQGAKYASYELPKSYEELKNLYYLKARADNDTQINDPSPSTIGDVTQNAITGLNDTVNQKNQIFNFKRNLTVSDIIPGTCNNYPTCTTLNAEKSAIIFVDGSLIIKDKNLIYNNGNAGIVFVVKGPVYIKEDVRRVDAIIISFDKICTSATDASGTTCPPSPTPCSGVNNSDPVFCQLVVDGSLISLNKDNPISFTRSLRDNREAAEVIRQQPKYLVILRNLFSQTLEVRNEY